MAEQPATAPPPSAGFKLKLKLGGGNSSTTVSSAQPTSATASAASPPVPSTSTLPTTSTANASVSTGSRDAAAEQANDEDVDMLEDANEDAQGDASMSNQADRDASMLSNASPGPSTARSQDPSTKYETAIGSIVLPTSSTSTAGPSKKRKSATTGEGGTTGLGRGWRKGMKGYQKGDLQSPGPGAGRGETMSTTSSNGGSAAPPSRKRKAPATSAAAAASATPGPGAGDESSLDRNQDAEDFTPAMAPPGGIVTNEKWTNGLPGGNEQSRLTASMANAVNRQFPVGLPPKTGSVLLQPQPLDKNTPPPRSWKKVKREIIGPSGIPFTVTIWQGDNESKYADYMVEHPRPPPVEKKPTATLAAGVEASSPAPEGSYPPSDGTPADAASESASAAGQTGALAGRGSRRSRGSTRGKATGPRKKPGPPKKNAVAPPPIGGAVTGSAAATPVPEASTTTAVAAADSTAPASAPNSVDAPSSEAPPPKIEFGQEESLTQQPKAEDSTDSPMPIAG